MSERQDTVREVCAEMNGNEFDDPHLNADGIVGARILAKDWAKRILVTYEREMEAKDAEIARLKAELKDYQELKYQYKQSVIDGNRKTMEISDMILRMDLLERALKPVMECAVCKADGTAVADGEICTSSDYGVCDYEGNELDWHDVAECLDAVREAQRIMKEGEAK